MGSQVGVVGQGNLGEQIKIAVKSGSTTAIVPPAVQNGTVTSDAINTLGANVAIAQVNVGAIVAAGNYTLKVQYSADGSTGWTDLPASTQAPGGSGASAFAVATTAGLIGTANTDVQLMTDLRALPASAQYIRYVGTLVSGTSVLWGLSVILGAYSVLPVGDN